MALGLAWAFIAYWGTIMEHESPQIAPWLFEVDIKPLLEFPALLLGMCIYVFVPGEVCEAVEPFIIRKSGLAGDLAPFMICLIPASAAMFLITFIQIAPAHFPRIHDVVDGQHSYDVENVMAMSALKRVKLVIQP
ncbi:hypothetical protein EST38_g6357 [Candolleomyces aberdarensis]|uniref:Uncharacterized protein n=1 Tax=Candolleomyces aberdarensis TaxID=2316362 RepID=A0A4Q2DJW8_9AGAR|nr:hypothetical protein EST38_g6357 [Candolleomyces aberdarensis]